MSAYGLSAEALGKIIAAAEQRGAAAERAKWMACATIDPEMGNLWTWNLVALDRLWRESDSHNK